MPLTLPFFIPQNPFVWFKEAYKVTLFIVFTSIPCLKLALPGKKGIKQGLSKFKVFVLTFNGFPKVIQYVFHDIHNNNMSYS